MSENWDDETYEEHLPDPQFEQDGDYAHEFDYLREGKEEPYQPIWERDLMPSQTVVLDFYKSELPDPDRQKQATWEAIPDHELDDSVPGYPEIAPYTQWKVVSGDQTWMIYQWWSGSGHDDDEYLYDLKEEPYVPTPSDLAIYASLQATSVVGAITQAHANGEISLETYNKLYNIAREALIAVETLNKRLEEESKSLAALKTALEQQREYQRVNWPFTGDESRPPVMGESITYHLASLYCWPPAYVLSLSEAERDERLQEIWKSFALAGDIIKRYENATVALLKQSEGNA